MEVVVPKEYFETPYALFASDDVMQMYCCEANIQGDVYGKEKFFCQGSQLHLNGTASTANKFTFANGVTDIKDSKEGIEPVILPDYMEHILVNMRADSECVDDIDVDNNTDINAPTLCKSTTGAWCDYVNINASLVSQGSISLNAQGVTSGKDKPIVLASQNGDIRIQTIDFEGSGLIYAPNGTVVINVNNFNYTGTIIAKKIEIQASYYNHSLLTSYW